MSKPEMESAEAFARGYGRAIGRYIDHGIPVPLIEARDAAVRLALLEELTGRADIHSRSGHGNGMACALAIVDMQEKYKAKGT